MTSSLLAQCQPTPTVAKREMPVNGLPIANNRLLYSNAPAICAPAAVRKGQLSRAQAGVRCGLCRRYNRSVTTNRTGEWAGKTAQWGTASKRVVLPRPGSVAVGQPIDEASSPRRLDNLMDQWMILGQGQIGRLIVARLRSAGLRVSASDRDGWQRAVAAHRGWLLLSLTRGDESADVADFVAGQASRGRIRGVVNLTTQSILAVEHEATALATVRIASWAGGLTGGATGVAAGTASVLIGPTPLARDVGIALRCLGRLIEFPSAHAAVVAKLLHNYVLLVVSEAMAHVLRVGMTMKCSEAMLAAVATGPAGRATYAQSIVRDALGRGITSYSCRLVNKDVDQIMDSLEVLGALDTALLRRVQERVRGRGELPFTTALLYPTLIQHPDVGGVLNQMEK